MRVIGAAIALTLISGCSLGTDAQQRRDDAKRGADCYSTTVVARAIRGDDAQSFGQVVGVDLDERSAVLVQLRIGGVDLDGDATGYAFVWRDGSRSDLRIPAGFAAIAVRDMSNRGEVAGYAKTSSGARTRAFVWRDGKPISIETADGDARALRVNDRGHVAGTVTNGPRTRGFFWDGVSTFDLGPGEVVDMNEVDEVLIRTCDGRCNAFLWHAGVRRTVGEALGLYPVALNNRGQVTGAVDVAPDEPHAFIVDDSSARDLGMPGIWSFPNAINDRGDVVGEDASTGGFIPVVWHAGETTRLASSYGEDMATDINESGWAVGSALNFPSLGAFVWADGRKTLLPNRRGDEIYVPANFSSDNRFIRINDRGDVLASTEISFLITPGDLTGRGDTAVVLWRRQACGSPPEPEPEEPTEE